MKRDFNQIGQFVGKWLAVGVVLHFGFKLAEWLDTFIPV